MRNLALAALVLLTPGSALAVNQKPGEPVDGREVFQRANEAVKQIKVVQYTAKLEGDGPEKDKIPLIQATATVTGWKNNSFEKFKFEGTVQEKPGDAPEKYTVGTDGDTYYLIDWQKKIVYADMDPVVQGKKGDLFRNIIVSRFVRPEGFQLELGAPTIELKDPAKVGDEDCYHVHLQFKSGDESEWYFSKKDFLLRRVDRFQPGENGQKTARILTLAKVTPNPNFVQDPFKLVVPEGFKKTDEFAP